MLTKRFFLRQLVKFKLHLIRVWSILVIPFQLFTTAGTAYLVVKQNSSLPLLIIAPIAGLIAIAVWWFDSKYLFKAEIDYSAEKTEIWKQILDKLERIEKRLDEKED